MYENEEKTSQDNNEQHFMVKVTVFSCDSCNEQHKYLSEKLKEKEKKKLLFF